jgi:hypothetical protein
MLDVVGRLKGDDKKVFIEIVGHADHILNLSTMAHFTTPPSMLIPAALLGVRS